MSQLIMRLWRKMMNLTEKNRIKRPGLPDLIEIIAQYEVYQRQLPKRLSGDVDYDNLKIRINKKQTSRDKTATLIHEAIHVYYMDRGWDAPEKIIVRQEKRLMKEWYK